MRNTTERCIYKQEINVKVSPQDANVETWSTPTSIFLRRYEAQPCPTIDASTSKMAISTFSSEWWCMTVYVFIGLLFLLVNMQLTIHSYTRHTKHVIANAILCYILCHCCFLFLHSMQEIECMWDVSCCVFVF